jgi:glycosyltransferase involved in cell wall biosynthesis
MKICFVVTGLPPAFVGGAETQTYNLATHLAKRHDVTILTRKTGDFPGFSRESGFHIKRFGFLDFPVIRFFSHVLSCLLEIRKIKGDVDVLYCMMLSPNGLAGVLAKKLFGLKSLASVRGGDWYGGEERLTGRMINRFVIKNSDLIITQTEKIKKEVREKYPDAKIEVVPNGVDAAKERATGDKIVFLGNLHKKKGLEYLIQAMDKIDAELLIVGDGPDMDKLQQLARGKRVSFAGKVKPAEVRTFLKRGKVFVLPSLYGEGMPNVILEAMSVGLPVVSTRISGIPDMVKEGKTGFLVEPCDPDSLADAVNKILKNGGLRKKMSANAVKEIKKYSWDNVVERVDKVLSAV